MKLALIALLACLILKCGGSTKQARPQGSDPTANAQQSNALDKVPSVARSIEVFNGITFDMSMQDIVKICGVPDRDIGSGIHIYVYQLSDGSAVHIGTPDRKRLFYVVHLQTNGEKRYLIQNNSR